MMKKIEIEEVHSLLLRMAKEIHRICVKHNIPYYMLGGTMLGAIRHKGFIPWDDDMDFGIPREYYSEFITKCHKELPSYMQIQTIENSDYAILCFAKLSDMRTVVQEEYAINTNQSIGINIDIFPLDHTNYNKCVFSFNWYVRTLFRLQKLLFMKADARSPYKKTLAQIMQIICPLKKNAIPDYLTKLMIKRSKKGNKYNVFANYFGGWGLKELTPKNVFGKPQLYPFENCELYGVNDYHKYLTLLYKDYMKLPPENKKHLHHLNIYWK